MLPRNIRMELLAKAYVRAIAAQAGCACDEFESDFGIDILIRGIVHLDNRYVDSGGLLEIQLKSTTTASVRIADGLIHYELLRKSYDRLRMEAKHRPISLLVLYVMPENEDEWMIQQPDRLTLQHCCHYMSLQGYPAITNPSKVVVEIPERNVFSVAFLQQLLRQEESS